ncbi:MAG: stage 0 sporulation family protein [Lachnospiraceae bacterium]|nr:stage 0 sporulation family protein [Lachnospiraceae bacterium]
MANVIGVHLRNGGKIQYYDPGDNEIRMHDHVIVESSRGVEYGMAMTLPREVDDKHFKSAPKKIIRIATEADDAKNAENREKEDEAYRVCKKKILEHELDMKLVEAEYTFDRNKLIFYFTADGRVDFRELVKDLAGIFRTRIELRQIGVRDETKIIGGIGICGRELCCRSYLEDFAPVSIKMAKEQNLSLNPTKISGVCGRLMCCLKNEEEAYEYLNKKLPRKGDEIHTKDGRMGEVQNVNILRQRVRVIFEVNDQREVEEFNAEDLVYEPGVHKKVKHNKNQNQGKSQDKQETRDNKKDSKRDNRQSSKKDTSAKNNGNPGNGSNKGQKKQGNEQGNGEGNNPSTHKKKNHRPRRNRNKGNGENTPREEGRMKEGKPSETK